MTFAVRTLREQQNPINIEDAFATNTSLAGIGGTATATYRLDGSGQAWVTNVSGVLIPLSNQWLLYGTASDFEVYATWSPVGGGPGGITGGGIVGGATPGVWLNLGTQRDYTLTETSGLAERELYVQIRQAASGVVLDSATITVQVDSAP